MRTFPALLFTGALALTAPLLVPEPTVAVSASAAGPADRAGAASDPDDPTTWQNSDQVRGPIAPRLTPRMRAQTTRTLRYKWRLAPSTRVFSYDERTARGPIRYYLVRMGWRNGAVYTDYAHAPYVRVRETVPAFLDDTRNVVAGINGDFFDIGDSDAPLGLGWPRDEKLRHGIDAGWNAAFYIPQHGAPDVGQVPMRTRIREHRDIHVTNYNSPQVKPNGIGVYDAKWGKTAGYRWTDGQRKAVRIVRVLDGKVTANRTSGFPSGFKVKGKYLVARGAAASRELRRLRKGTPIHISAWAKGLPKVLITGNSLLVMDGRIVNHDDGEMHPRTAVGIDRKRKQILFLVVDGRQSFSRGYTMLELARKLKQHGAADGLNLDGGGSSTLVVRRNGRLRVINSPSDGALRPVPNGLQMVQR